VSGCGAAPPEVVSPDDGGALGPPLDVLDSGVGA
jgi:hypothetical protein